VSGGPPLLEVSGLAVAYATRRGRVHAVQDVGFRLENGRSLGLVGESGCGKSQTCFAIMGLVGRNARVTGSVRLEGRELVGLSRRQLDRVRGSRIGMIFQDPMTALTPHMTVGAQLTEVVRHHEGASRGAARDRALEIMERMRINEPARRYDMYPFELSGGMRQRIVIAAALILRPSLVLADEPTTALDVTVQAEVLRALRGAIDHTNTSLILVSHDLGVVSGICDEVAVMYAGRIVEHGEAAEVFAAPRHPYTRALLACRPALDAPASRYLPAIDGQPPAPGAKLDPGCAFRGRCPAATGRCATERPLLSDCGRGGRHQAACLVEVPECGTSAGEAA
jgi:oligopeptide/dipeptide ABC transporter ATP-binding protein